MGWCPCRVSRRSKTGGGKGGAIQDATAGPSAVLYKGLELQIVGQGVERDSGRYLTHSVEVAESRKPEVNAHTS